MADKASTLLELQKDGMLFEKIEDKLKMDRDCAMAAVKQNGLAL